MRKSSKTFAPNSCKVFNLESGDAIGTPIKAIQQIYKLINLHCNVIMSKITNDIEEVNNNYI